MPINELLKPSGWRHCLGSVFRVRYLHGLSRGHDALVSRQYFGTIMAAESSRPRELRCDGLMGRSPDGHCERGLRYGVDWFVAAQTLGLRDSADDTQHESYR